MSPEQLPHRVVLSTGNLKLKEIDAPLKKKIDSFEKEYASFMQSPPPNIKASNKFKTLFKKSDKLGEYIYINFIDEEPKKEYTSDELDGDLKELDAVLLKLATSAPKKKVVVVETAPIPEPTPEPVKPAPTPAPIPKKVIPKKTPAPTSAPVVADVITFDSEDEEALHKLYAAGTTSNLTKEMLGAAGFDIGFWTDLGRYGCTIGRYRLERPTTNVPYKLVKIK